jgi:single-strand DNA-binding protein
MQHTRCSTIPEQREAQKQKIKFQNPGGKEMLNKIVIMGRLVSDPEMRRTGSGVAVTNFTIACDRDFGQNGEKETDFIECVAWRQTGEFVSKYFTKGRMAVVSGRLQIRNWEDKDGNKRKSAEVVAEDVYFGDSKNSNADNSTGTFGGYAAPASAPATDFAMLDDDDSQLPF